MVTKYEKIFVQKLRQLLCSPTFDDIAFNCKDGKVSGNRLILSLYSSFLRKIFEDNPNIVSHPLNDDPTTGVNITEIEVKDVENLLKILNTQTAADVNEDSVDGIVDAARLMEIELKVDKLRNGLVRIRAIPNFNENSPKKTSSDGGKAVGIAVIKENGNAAITSTKETKATKQARNSRSKQQSKAKHKVKSLSSTSTVCPYCNITCKSFRGLQVHIGYIHKNEANNVKNETNEKNIVTESSKPETNSQKSCGTEKSDLLLSVKIVASDDLTKLRDEQNMMASSSLFVNDDTNKPILGPAYGIDDHMDAQTTSLMTDDVYTNNGEHFNQFSSYSVGNFAPNPQLATACLIDGLPLQKFIEPAVTPNLSPGFPLLPRQQGQGTLICLPKTQLYEQIENGYSCGICEMKFPNLANLNVHMTYCHGLTILVKEN